MLYRHVVTCYIWLHVLWQVAQLAYTANPSTSFGRIPVDHSSRQNCSSLIKLAGFLAQTPPLSTVCKSSIALRLQKLRLSLLYLFYIQPWGVLGVIVLHLIFKFQPEELSLWWRILKQSSFFIITATSTSSAKHFIVFTMLLVLNPSNLLFQTGLQESWNSSN